MAPAKTWFLSVGNIYRSHVAFSLSKEVASRPILTLFCVSSRPQRSRTSVSRATRPPFGRRACRSSSRNDCCGTELRQLSASILSPHTGRLSTITWQSGPRPKSRETTTTKKVKQKKKERIRCLLHRPSPFCSSSSFSFLFL